MGHQVACLQIVDTRKKPSFFHVCVCECHPGEGAEGRADLDEGYIEGLAEVQNCAIDCKALN